MNDAINEQVAAVMLSTSSSDPATSVSSEATPTVYVNDNASVYEIIISLYIH